MPAAGLGRRGKSSRGRDEGEGSGLSLAETIQRILPELAKPGSSDLIFGKPVEAGGAVLLPVARLAVGFLGLDAAGRSGLGGGLSLEPVAVVVIQDGQVSVKRLTGGLTAGAANAGDSFAGSGLDALVAAIRPLLRAGAPARTSAPPAPAGKTGGPAPDGTGPAARGGGRRRRGRGRQPLDLPEEQVVEARAHHVADRREGEGQREA